MIFKNKEAYIAPTTTFDLIDEREQILTGSMQTDANDKDLTHKEDELNGSGSSARNSGFDEGTFDFGSWD